MIIIVPVIHYLNHHSVTIFDGLVLRCDLIRYGCHNHRQNYTSHGSVPSGISPASALIMTSCPSLSLISKKIKKFNALLDPLVGSRILDNRSIFNIILLEIKQQWDWTNLDHIYTAQDVLKTGNNK